MFVKPPWDWADTTQTTELTAPTGAAGDVFGYAVAISGNVALTSAPFHAVGANLEQGVVVVFGEPPTMTIGTPANGATFTQRLAVSAAYGDPWPALVHGQCR